METDKFIEDRKAEFKPGKIEYASMNIFRTQRFIRQQTKRSVKRYSFSNYPAEYACFDIVDGFLIRMES